MTKQEPPADWSVTPGEDRFFAQRMAAGIGIAAPAIPTEEQYYLQGLEANGSYGGERWLRLASLYPESINYVEFYRNDELYSVAYDEPFSVHYLSNWRQGGVKVGSQPEQWHAVIHLSNGEVIERGIRQS
jgi:hypothetical protein